MKKNISKLELLRRLQIIEGHLNRVMKMIEGDFYCIDILQQSHAVRNAMKKVEELLLERHLHSCVVRAVRNKGNSKALDELLDVFRKVG